MGVDMLELQNGYMLNGDCLELMKDIADKSIDMILTDLPYGTTACKWDTIIPFEPLWEQYKRIIKDNGAIVLFGAEPFSSYLRMSNIKEYRYDWTWIKNRSGGAVSAACKPLSCVENISVFYQKQPTYNAIMVERSEKELSKLSKNSTCFNSDENGVGFNKEYIQNRDNLKLKYPRRDIYIPTVFNRSKEKCDHPTQKPVALFEYLIKTYTNEGKLVLDNCSGSGTTAIACINTNRNYICIEKDETYFNKSVERINNHVRIKNIRIITELPL